MTRALFSFLALALVAVSNLTAFVGAVPVGAVETINLNRRLPGSPACNAARLKIVGNLAATTGAVARISSSGNTTVADAVSTAKTGLQGAKDGIKTIAGALLKGQATPPPEARDQVAAGLKQANDALSGITATGDARTDNAVGKAMAKLQDTIGAGEDVLSLCGGGGGDVAGAAADTATATTATATATAASVTVPADAGEATGVDTSAGADATIGDDATTGGEAATDDATSGGVLDSTSNASV